MTARYVWHDLLDWLERNARRTARRLVTRSEGDTRYAVALIALLGVGLVFAGETALQPAPQPPAPVTAEVGP